MGCPLERNECAGYQWGADDRDLIQRRDRYLISLGIPCGEIPCMASFPAAVLLYFRDPVGGSMAGVVGGSASRCCCGACRGHAPFTAGMVLVGNTDRGNDHTLYFI